MNNRFVAILMVWIGLPLCVLAQPVSTNARTEINTLLQGFFQKMARSDTNNLVAFLLPEATVLSTKSTPLNANKTEPQPALPMFKRTFAASPAGSLVEKIHNINIVVDDQMASAVMDYEFYYNGNFSHCGKNNITLLKTTDGWRMLHLVDSRRSENCAPKKTELIAYLDSLTNRWHQAAATADEATFFGLMPPNGIYLGTDATERWTAQAMKTWAAPYFERDTAWAFTPTVRHFQFNQDRTVAWFDELLDTWMDTCRGSGVWEKQPDQTWKLVHYHLSIAVPNDKVKGYLELLNE